MEPAKPKLRDRVIDFRRIKASEIRRNPLNWRLHPEGQKDALNALLREVGFVGSLLVRQLPDGSYELIDGHLRADQVDDAEVPVTVVDLNDDEARKVLTTYDPLAAMAIPDAEKLGELVKSVDFESDAELRRLLTDIEKMIAKEQEEKDDEESEREIPGMGLQPHEHYDYLVILATTTQEWNVLLGKLNLQSERRHGRMGVCRAVRAIKLLQLIAGLEAKAAVAEATA